MDNFALFGSSPAHAVDLMRQTLSWSAFEQTCAWQVLLIENGHSVEFTHDFIPRLLRHLDPSDHFEAMIGLTLLLVATQRAPKLLLDVVGAREGGANFLGVVEKVCVLWNVNGSTGTTMCLLKGALEVLESELGDGIGKVCYDCWCV